MSTRLHNIAFIDAQNLHLGTAEDSWKVDLYKLRKYLKDKYHVHEAYYFPGHLNEEYQELYRTLQKAGFIVHFKEHTSKSISKKKGNVDTDIVFEMMKTLIEDDFDKLVLVSGDGDYKKVVDYLIKNNKFEKILFPNKKFASSLYKQLGAEYFDSLCMPNVRAKIAYTQKKRAP